MNINCQPLLRYDLFTSTRILIYPEYPIMHCGIDFSKMASLSVKRSIDDTVLFAVTSSHCTLDRLIYSNFHHCSACTGGGNYCISTYQVYNGLKLQRIKLYHQLEMSEKLHISVSDQCCENLKENIEDLDILDSCFQISL